MGIMCILFYRRGREGGKVEGFGEGGEGVHAMGWCEAVLVK